MNEQERPEMVTDDMLEYLDSLREPGAANMFGSWRFVRGKFCLSRRDAKAVVQYWMQTFGERVAND